MKFYRVYQLPHNNKKLFRNLAAVGEVNIHDYCCVWANELAETDLDEETICEDLFNIFNIDHPKGFGGHSMSVSDIVMIHNNEGEGSTNYYYCDSIGFKKIKVKK